MNKDSLIFISLLITGCSGLSQPKLLKKTENPLLSSRAEFTKVNNQDGSQMWHRLIKFEVRENAQNYFFQRRLDLQRLYEVTSEPYFGTPEEKKCENNIDISAKIKKIKNGEFFFLKMLENDNFALGDCLMENNKLKAIYEFYACDKIVYEVRWHLPYSVAENPLPSFYCPQSEN